MVGRVMTRGRAKMQAVPDACDALTALLSRPALAALIRSYLTVPELVSNRGVSLQWHQLFSQASCGHGKWLFAPTNRHVVALEQRATDMHTIDPSLLARLGCQRNVFASVPHLHRLDVHHGMFNYHTYMSDSELKSVDDLLFQLAECTNLPLKQLNVADAKGMSAAVLRALPHLEELDAYMSPEADHRMTQQTIDDLIGSAPPGLQHYSWLGGCRRSLAQLPQLAQRFSGLTSLAVERAYDVWSNEELTVLLTPCRNIVTLDFNRGQHDDELMDILCEMPKLRHFSTKCADGMDVQFLDRLGALRTCMERHATDKQQDVTLHMYDMFSCADIEDGVLENKWWFSAAQAAIQCDVFEISQSSTFQDRQLTGYEDLPAQARNDMLVMYVKLLSVTEIELHHGHNLTHNQLYQLLSHQAWLNTVDISCNSPAVVYQALADGHSLNKLCKLQIRWPACADFKLLGECLFLVSAAIKLQELTIEATVAEWTQASVSTLMNCTAHVAKVHIVSTVAEATVAQVFCVTGMLLMLPNLATLNDTGTLTLEQMQSIRSRSGLSPVFN